MCEYTAVTKKVGFRFYPFPRKLDKEIGKSFQEVIYSGINGHLGLDVLPDE